MQWKYSTVSEEVRRFGLLINDDYFFEYKKHQREESIDILK